MDVLYVKIEHVVWISFIGDIDFSCVGVLEPGVPQPTSEFVLRAPDPGWWRKETQGLYWLGNRGPTSSPRDQSCIPCTGVLVVGGYKLGERGS